MKKKKENGDSSAKLSKVAEQANKREAQVSPKKSNSLWIRKDVVTALVGMNEYDFSSFSKILQASKTPKVVCHVANFNFNATYNTSV